jgi:hypothetical protein
VTRVCDYKLCILLRPVILRAPNRNQLGNCFSTNKMVKSSFRIIFFNQVYIGQLHLQWKSAFRPKVPLYISEKMPDDSVSHLLKDPRQPRAVITGNNEFCHALYLWVPYDALWSTHSTLPQIFVKMSLFVARRSREEMATLATGL